MDGILLPYMTSLTPGETGIQCELEAAIFLQLLLLWWHASQLLILPCARQKSVLLLSLASTLSNADPDSELRWSELNGIAARQRVFSALMHSPSLTAMGKPGWRSKRGCDGHPPLFCPSDQMLSQSLFSSCFQGRNYELSLSFHCHSQKE